MNQRGFPAIHRFKAAQGETIFLDEIGDLLPDTQVALLRNGDRLIAADALEFMLLLPIEPIQFRV